ncbi:FkbM family methyltransferase [Saliphagus sp. GCM10025308]
MTFIDWLRYSVSEIRSNGATGVHSAADELFWGARDRFRRLAPLTSSTKSVSIGPHTVDIHNRTVGEFDHIRAIHNESPNIEHFCRHLTPDDCVWDVGSNIGVYTLFAATIGAETVAIEPWQENVETIEKNLALNDLQAHVVDRALAESAGPREFTLDNRATAGAGRGSLLSDWQHGDTITVKCVRGDELAGQNVPKPTVIKVDVEGAELSVLKGMDGILEGVRRIYCELHGVDDEAVHSLLLENGFNIEATPDESGCGILRAVR